MLLFSTFLFFSHRAIRPTHPYTFVAQLPSTKNPSRVFPPPLMSELWIGNSQHATIWEARARARETHRFRIWSITSTFWGGSCKVTYVYLALLCESVDVLAFGLQVYVRRANTTHETIRWEQTLLYKRHRMYNTLFCRSRNQRLRRTGIDRTTEWMWADTFNCLIYRLASIMRMLMRCV